MFVVGLGTATPAHCYSQSECWQAVQESGVLSRLKPRSRALLHKVLTGDNGIDWRFLALDDLQEAFQLNPDVLHHRFRQHAPAVALRAAEQALADAGVSREAIDGVLISTCTGYLCPGLTSYVGEGLGLRRDIPALDLVGQGCGAALPNLGTARAMLDAGQCERVLSICVEICSAAFYLDDDPGVLISAGLFGDGAAAAVLANGPRSHGRRVEWITGQSLASPENREILRFDQREGMLRNILAPTVPELAAEQAAEVLERARAKEDFPDVPFSAWILHAGGQKVLDALQNRLALSEEAVGWSASILRDYGNLSSPFVLFVLQAALRQGAPDGFWWLSSFGAGFTCHGALLKVG